ncbi:unnamed protein product, partial [Sphacelaria rigidula]
AGSPAGRARAAAAAASFNAGPASQAPATPSGEPATVKWGPVLSSFACLTLDGSAKEWDPEDDRQQRRVRIRSPSNASSLPDSLQDQEQNHRRSPRDRESSENSSLPASLVDGQDEGNRQDEGTLPEAPTSR